MITGNVSGYELPPELEDVLYTAPLAVPVKERRGFLRDGRGQEEPQGSEVAVALR